MVLVASLLSLFAAAGALGVAASADPTAERLVPQIANSDGLSPVASDPSIVLRHPLHLESWSLTPTSDALALHFPLPSPDCSGVDADVNETSDSVIVSLSAGSRPRAVGRMCTMIVVNATLDVTLKAPLGDRVVMSTI